MNQTKQVLELLKENGVRGVTQKDAISELRGYRLSARIKELRDHGAIIDTDGERGYGKFARYVLVDEIGMIQL